MLDRVKHETVSMLSRVQIRTEAEVEAMEKQRREAAKMKFQHAAAPAATGTDSAVPVPGPTAAGPVGQTGPVRRPGPGPRAQAAPAAEPHTPFVREQKKVGRNEPCPCGSGKKFKHCHGRLG
jgi:preprotein translocase subunit SecA